MRGNSGWEHDDDDHHERGNEITEREARRYPGLVGENRRVPTMEDIVAEEERQRKGRGSSKPYPPLKPPSRTQTKRKKRLSSPERFEIKQLIASGVLNAADYPELYNDFEDHVMEEDVEVEVKPEEPRFLKGQLHLAAELSPVRIVKNPEGSLNRAAMAGASLASERRELKQEKSREDRKQQGEEQRKAQQSWQDPASTERKFADELRRKGTGEMPEWKRAAIGDDSHRRDEQWRPHLSRSMIREQRESLPIFQLKKELIAAINEHQILVVIGDTGSGKTTQLTQYLAESGLYTRNNHIIGCTQPRRVAAMSVSKRVSEEVGCKLGDFVGYTIRFEDCTSRATQIKYMTDGMLLRECLQNPNVPSYSVVILDEAHERTIHTDVLFGLLKAACRTRPDLKLIVTSATLEAEKFSAYFDDCPIFTIPGRTFPVEMLFTQQPEPDYLDAALVTVMQIHLNEPPGDILLFLTGQEEIDSACEILYERVKALGKEVPSLLVLPVYSAMPGDLQARISEPAPPNSRKCVIATNIAETSITIDGIYYVVDPGFCKQKAYNPKLGMDSLVVTPISQAQARQRAGRAGRTGPGKAYRLYTEAAYEKEMLPAPVPEIQRTNLANTVLTLKAMGINDLLHFDFMDPPPLPTMIAAMEVLFALGALDDDGFLTKLGRKMAEFPLEPALSKMLLYAVDVHCSEEALTIVAMLSVQTIFYRPKERQEQADQRHARLRHPEGDHLTLLAVFDAWRRNGGDPGWCRTNFLQARSLRRADDVRKQLLRIMQRYRQPVLSCGEELDLVRKAICAGFFTHAARRDPHEGYRTLVEAQPVVIHPSSALFGKSPEWVIYHELVMTSREYMRQVTTIEPKWLVEVAPTYFQLNDPRELSKKKKEEKVTPLYNKHEAPDEWRLSSRKALFRTHR
jgi:ATP-dependent RNA helicase DHX8/PRP22